MRKFGFVFLFLQMLLLSFAGAATSRNDSKKSANNQENNSFFYGYAMFGAGYGNNIYNHTKIKTTPYKDIKLDNNTTIISDIFHKEVISLYHFYQINNNWSWISSADFYNKRYKNHDDLSISQISFSTGPKFSFGDSSIYVPIYTRRMWYRGKGYMNIYGTSPTYRYSFDKNTQFEIRADATVKRLIESGKKDYDTNRLELSAALKNTRPSNVYFAIESGIYGERRVHGSRYDINYNAAFVSGKYQFPIYKDIYMSTKLTAELRKYINKHPNLPLRKDLHMKFDMTLNKKLNKNTTVSITYSHKKNNSNINLYHYHNHTFALSLATSF